MGVEVGWDKKPPWTLNGAHGGCKEGGDLRPGFLEEPLFPQFPFSGPVMGSNSMIMVMNIFNLHVKVFTL